MFSFPIVNTSYCISVFRYVLANVLVEVIGIVLCIVSLNEMSIYLNLALLSVSRIRLLLRSLLGARKSQRKDFLKPSLTTGVFNTFSLIIFSPKFIILV